MSSSGSVPPLAAAAGAFASGALDAVAFSTVFLSAQVFAARPAPPAPPGLVAVGARGAGLVPVFSSLPQLARHSGECDWLATTGADLLGLLPAGYGLVLDVAGEQPLLLPASALRRGVEPGGREARR